MKSKTTSADTRQRLLDAASNIILRDGISHLTLDAVAREAQVSKGGLLYHFPAKEQLLQGLVEHLIDDFYERMNIELEQANEPAGTPGRWLRAYIRATGHPSLHEQKISAALAVALAEDPHWLDYLKECFEAMHQQALNDGLDPALATLIRLSVDGLWFSDVLQLSLDETLRAKLLERLLSLTQGV